MSFHVRRSDDGVFTLNKFDSFETVAPGGERTLLELFVSNLKTNPDDQILGFIKDEQIVFRTFLDVISEIRPVASVIQSIVGNKENKLVGIFSINRYEWIVAEYATYFIGTANCPLFSNFSPEALRQILTETKMEVLVVSAEKLNHLFNIGVLGSDSYSCSITHVIILDDSPELVEKCRNAGIKARFYSEIIKDKDLTMNIVLPKPSEMATLCYTSGTSGLPKGVMLSHENMMANVLAFTTNKDPALYPLLTNKDTYVSYLPLPHVLERICFTAAFALRAKIIFYRGNPKLLQADLKIIKPTFIVTVPRVLNVFMEKIKEKIATKNIFIRALFNIGLKYKLWRGKSGVYKSWLFDNIIFKKIAEEFGGSMRYSLCGGAPLNPDVQAFIQSVLCMKIFQGYGQTEGFAANIVMPLNSSDLKSVGVPFPSMEIKLAPVEDFEAPEGGHVGEILMRGKAITKGYYKREKETKEIFTEDGWLRTGDVATERDGLFYIVGRVKDLFKTSFGEYIIPEKIELELVDGKYVQDMFCTSSTYSNYLCAIVVCTDARITEKEIMDSIKKRGDELVRSSRLKRYEIPEKVMVRRKGFDELNTKEPLITPSLKKRRKLILAHFQRDIDSLYGEAKKHQ